MFGVIIFTVALKHGIHHLFIGEKVLRLQLGSCEGDYFVALWCLWVELSEGMVG